MLIGRLRQSPIHSSSSVNQGRVRQKGALWRTGRSAAIYKARCNIFSEEVDLVYRHVAMSSSKEGARKFCICLDPCEQSQLGLAKVDLPKEQTSFIEKSNQGRCWATKAWSLDELSITITKRKVDGSRWRKEETRSARGGETTRATILVSFIIVMIWSSECVGKSGTETKPPKQHAQSAILHSIRALDNKPTYCREFLLNGKHIEKSPFANSPAISKN